MTCSIPDVAIINAEEFKMNKTKYIIAFISLLIVFLAIFVIARTQNKDVSFSGYPELPAAVVEKFYGEYLEMESTTQYEEVFSDNRYLTESFRDSLGSIDTSTVDPFVCSKDKPRGLNIHDPVYEGDESAVVQVDENFGATVSVINVVLEKTDGYWQIDRVICSNNSSANPTGTFVVYFNNEQITPEGNTDCGLVYGVERTSTSQQASYEEKLNTLFAGPTEEEKSAGYTSFFSSQTSGILKSVKIDGSTAYVDLQDVRNLIPSASSSCGSASFTSQVEETLKHDREISKVIYAINGDPEVFYEWMQFGCSENICDKTPFLQP
jgi:hypothetical protein